MQGFNYKNTYERIETNYSLRNRFKIKLLSDEKKSLRSWP